MTHRYAQVSTLPLLAALVLAIATITGAWFFELVISLAPCPLCLTQRWPYYIGIPVIILTLYLYRQKNKNLALAGTVAVTAVFLAGVGLGIYHSGIEWRYWEGPSECSGGVDLDASVGNLLADLKKAKVVSCIDAAWRFLGLSLAGYNAIISGLIAYLSLRAFRQLKAF